MTKSLVLELLRDKEIQMELKKILASLVKVETSEPLHIVCPRCAAKMANITRFCGKCGYEFQPKL